MFTDTLTRASCFLRNETKNSLLLHSSTVCNSQQRHSEAIRRNPVTSNVFSLETIIKGWLQSNDKEGTNEIKSAGNSKVSKYLINGKIDSSKRYLNFFFDQKNVNIDFTRLPSANSDQGRELLFSSRVFYFLLSAWCCCCVVVVSAGERRGAAMWK